MFRKNRQERRGGGLIDFEKKLAGNIKNYNKSCYAYVRSKQKVRDKVGPLENNSENIISDIFQMLDVLN